MKKSATNYWVKVIAFIMIQCFLLIGIAWAGHAKFLIKPRIDCLSPQLQIDAPILVNNFQELYGQSGHQSSELEIINKIMFALDWDVNGQVKDQIIAKTAFELWRLIIDTAKGDRGLFYGEDLN